MHGYREKKASYQFLLVFDSEEKAEDIKKALARAGFSSSCIRAGSQFELEAVLNWPWDAIIVDAQHPTAPPHHVLEYFSSVSVPPPVVAVSEVSDVSHATGLLRSGTADFLLWSELTLLPEVMQSCVFRHAENVMRLSDRRFSRLAGVSLDATSEAVLWLDRLGRFVFANKAAREKLGHNMGEMLLTSVSGIVPELEPGRWAALWRLLQGRSELVLSFDAIRADGRVIPVEATFSIMEYGAEKCLCVFARDVTERRRIESALEREERRYKDLFHNSPISLWEEDLSDVQLYFDQLRRQGVTDFHEHFASHPDDVLECVKRVRIIDVNQATLDLLEADSKQALLAGLDKVFTGDSLSVVSEEFAVLASGKTFYSGELDHRTLSGKVIRVAVHFSVADNYRRSLGRVVVSLLDVTERKQMQRELESARDRLEQRVAERTRELDEMNRHLLREVEERRKAEENIRLGEQRHRTIVDALPVLVHAHAEDGTIAYWNHECERVLGYASADIIGRKDFRELLYPDPIYRAEIEKMHEGGVVSEIEIDTCTAQGETRTIRWSASDLESPVQGWVHWETGVDVTDARIAAQRIQHLMHVLLRAQEDERKRLSLELHDNVAQYLSSLKIMSETLFDGELQVSESLRERAGTLSQRLQECIASVRDMAYRLRPSSLDQLGLVQTVEQFCRELSAERDVPIGLSVAGMENLHPDFDTEINLYRLVQEGVRNAVEHSQATAIEVKLVASSPNLLLRIEDNGCGFDVDARRREAVQEKRMGLESMEERVRLLGGDFVLTSIPGKGTKVFVKVPYRKKQNEPR